MNFDLKKPKLNKIVENEELEGLVERSHTRCGPKQGKVKADAIYKKMMDGKVKEL